MFRRISKTFYFGGGGTGSGGTGINLPADHIFASEAARDAAIPTPEEGEQCAIQSGVPQYHLLQEYRVNAWVDITYIIQGPQGEKGETGNTGDPTELIDDTQELQDKTYSSKKIGELLVEGTGFPDHGTISDLTTAYGPFFETKAEGKYYLDGWDENSGLPVDGIPENQRVMAVTNFQGYDGNDNAARVVFSSHLYGVFEGVKTSGVWGELRRLDNPKVNGTYYDEISTGDGLETELNGGIASIKQTMKKSVWPVHHVDTAVPIEIDSVDDLGTDYRYVVTETDHQLILKNENIPDQGQIKVSCEVDGSGLSRPVKVTTESGKEYYISTPTIFIFRDSDWFVDESSQLVHLENTTQFSKLGAEFQKKAVHGIAVDPSSDLTSAVNDEGVLIIGRGFTPITDTVDIAFWWSDHAEPDENDILNAMSQAQSDDVKSHTDGFGRTDLQSKTMTAKRNENAFKYAFFAWPSNFFTPEPSKIDTGFGAPSTWIPTQIVVESVSYHVLTVEIKNNSISLEEYSLVQEGAK